MANKNSQVPAAGAGGAQAGARQQNPAVCAEVKNWIDDLRRDMYMAMVLDRFIDLVNGYLETVAQEHGAEAVKIAKDDVGACLKYDDTVKIVKAKNGVEVLWLWGGWRLYEVVDRIIEFTAKEGEAAASAP